MSEQKHTQELTELQVEQIYHANAKAEIDRLRAELAAEVEQRMRTTEWSAKYQAEISQLKVDRAALVEILKDAREILDIGGASHVIGVDRAMVLIKNIDSTIAQYGGQRAEEES